MHTHTDKSAWGSQKASIHGLSGPGPRLKKILLFTACNYIHIFYAFFHTVLYEKRAQFHSKIRKCHGFLSFLRQITLFDEIHTCFIVLDSK